MTTTLARFPGFPLESGAALCEVSAVADTIVQTLRITRALLLSGRNVCLEGLEVQIAQLCARCLGLACSDATSMRLHLLVLRAELDATIPLLEAWHTGASCPSTIS